MVSWKKIITVNLLTVSGWSTDIVGVYDDSTWYYLPSVTTGFGTLYYTIYFVFVYVFPYALLVSYVIETILLQILKKYEFEFNKLKNCSGETKAIYSLRKIFRLKAFSVKNKHKQTCCYLSY